MNFFGRCAGLVAVGVLVVASSIGATSAKAAPVLVDFNELPDGVVGNPLVYPSVSFSGGLTLFADGGRICAMLLTNCGQMLEVDFFAPVSGISFFTADEGSGYSSVEISVIKDGVAVAFFQSAVDGNSLTTDFHDLSSYTGVTKLLLRPMGAGLGMNFDDFRFTTGGDSELPPTAHVPEPSSWALAGAGLGLLGLGKRRRSKRHEPGSACSVTMAD